MPPIYRIARIERHAIGTNGNIVAALLDDRLHARMAARTQSLQPTKPKLRVIVTVRLNVIDASGSRETASGKAQLFRHKLRRFLEQRGVMRDREPKEPAVTAREKAMMRAHTAPLEARIEQLEKHHIELEDAVRTLIGRSQ